MSEQPEDQLLYVIFGLHNICENRSDNIMLMLNLTPNPNFNPTPSKNQIITLSPSNIIWDLNAGTIVTGAFVRLPLSKELDYEDKVSLFVQHSCVRFDLYSLLSYLFHQRSG